MAIVQQTSADKIGRQLFISMQCVQGKIWRIPYIVSPTIGTRGRFFQLYEND
ncbi:hypothetical protein QTP88_005613 [Uroleucon formosanum]